jgi:hypothetical protein
LPYENLELISSSEAVLNRKKTEYCLEANRALLKILSHIADDRGIKLGFHRAIDRGKEYADLCDQELHLETLAWSDEKNFWRSLPERIALPDGSGRIDKESLKKIVEGQARVMFGIVSASL